jgi:hypothetical protein
MPLANIEDILEQHDKKVKEGMDYIVVTPSMISKRKREGWDAVTTMQGTVDQLLVVMERKAPEPPPPVPEPVPEPIAAEPVIKHTPRATVTETKGVFGRGKKRGKK